MKYHDDQSYHRSLTTDGNSQFLNLNFFLKNESARNRVVRRRFSYWQRCFSFNNLYLCEPGVWFLFIIFCWASFSLVQVLDRISVVNQDWYLFRSNMSLGKHWTGELSCPPMIVKRYISFEKTSTTPGPSTIQQGCVEGLRKTFGWCMISWWVHCLDMIFSVQPVYKCIAEWLSLDYRDTDTLCTIQDHYGRTIPNSFSIWSFGPFWWAPHILACTSFMTCCISCPAMHLSNKLSSGFQYNTSFKTKNLVILCLNSTHLELLKRELANRQLALGPPW